MDQYKLSKLGTLLEQSLANIEAHEHALLVHKKGETLHVPNVANVLLFAYEQLRNASENIEDHLLMQRAILRFYKRNLLIVTTHKTHILAKELVTELTQAQYLENDSVSLTVIKDIEQLIKQFLASYELITNTKQRAAEDWILELLTVKTEQLLNSHFRILSFVHFAHAHFTELIDYDEVIANNSAITKDDKTILLYISIHKALLKSDDANIRSGLFDLYSVSPLDKEQFITFNKRFDKLASSPEANKLARFITRNGAPLYIIKSLFFDNDTTYSAADLKNTSKTSTAINSQIETVYKEVRQNVNKGIFKGIIFLLITKALIGLLIEIPYDILVTGSIVIVPLVINLLFPPIFLAVTALTFKLPGNTNRRALTEYIESMLYTDKDLNRPTLKYPEQTENSKVFNIIFILVFIAVFYFTAQRLGALGFNIVQGIIFILFLSTASFLGYRLTVQIKEIEHVKSNQGFISLLRDFIYTPFIFLGKRLSYRFGQLNIIAQILDIAVDLPLKTLVKLLRQWLTFLNNKKDELL
jgi:hypothetical protein